MATVTGRNNSGGSSRLYQHRLRFFLAMRQGIESDVQCHEAIFPTTFSTEGCLEGARRTALLRMLFGMPKADS